MLNKILQMSRDLASKVLRCRKNESVTENLHRRKVAIERVICRGGISREALRDALINLGLNEGDNIIVHCAWREFFNYESTPNSVIEILLEIIGKQSNLAMPCYGSDNTLFDVNHTPSAAGVLSEVFRTEYDVLRSNCSHFSMAVTGPNAKELTNSQIDSRCGFNELGTYAKMLSLPGCKVLFLGLGKYPLQITQMHIEEYRLRERYAWIKALFTEEYEAILLNTPSDGQCMKKSMIKRKGGRPNKKNRTLIYKQLQNYKRSKLGNIDLVLINAEDSKLSIDKCIDAKRMF